MLKPRSKKIQYYMKPGFCPSQALPDSTLLMDTDMGRISEGMKYLINTSTTSRFVYKLNEFEGSVFYDDYDAKTYAVVPGEEMTYELIDAYASIEARNTSYVLYLSICLGALLGHFVGYVLFKMFQHLETTLERYLFDKRKLNSLKKTEQEKKKPGSSQDDKSEHHTSIDKKYLSRLTQKSLVESIYMS